MKKARAMTTSRRLALGPSIQPGETPRQTPGFGDTGRAPGPFPPGRMDFA